jgi:hypothetical protein
VVFTPFLLLSFCCAWQLGTWGPQAGRRKSELGEDLSLPTPWHLTLVLHLHHPSQLSLRISRLVSPSVLPLWQLLSLYTLTCEMTQKQESGKSLTLAMTGICRAVVTPLGILPRRVNSRVSLYTKTEVHDPFLKSAGATTYSKIKIPINSVWMHIHINCFTKHTVLRSFSLRGKTIQYELLLNK